MFSPYCSCFLCGHICLVSSLLLFVQWMTRYFPSFMFCVWEIGHETHINLKPLTFNHNRPTCKCFVFFFNVDFDFDFFNFFNPSFCQFVIKTNCIIFLLLETECMFVFLDGRLFLINFSLILYILHYGLDIICDSFGLIFKTPS